MGSTPPAASGEDPEETWDWGRGEPCGEKAGDRRERERVGGQHKEKAAESKARRAGMGAAESREAARRQGAVATAAVRSST